MKHYLIFVHGIGTGTADDSYNQLSTRIARSYCTLHNLKVEEFNQQFQSVYVEWGNVTYEAKKDIYQAAFPELSLNAPGPLDIFNLARPLRFFVTFFLGDVTAYTDEDDDNIRSSFWEQIQPAVCDQPFTLIAHSLGSVIAFDFLFNIFEKDGNDFFPAAAAQEKVDAYHNSAGVVRSNFRNFCTFGSPIGLFMMRKSTLWKKPPRFQGLINPVRDGGSDQIQPRWLNFYDKQDVLAYPLTALFAKNGNNSTRALVDIQVQTGDFFLDSHIGYWHNDTVAEKIAAILP